MHILPGLMMCLAERVQLTMFQFAHVGPIGDLPQLPGFEFQAFVETSLLVSDVSTCTKVSRSWP